MIPQENFPVKLHIKGHFSGYYSFNARRSRQFHNIKYINYGFYASPEKGENVFNEFENYPKIWSENRYKLKVFLPIMDTSPALVIRSDVLDMIRDDFVLSPILKYREIGFIARGQEIIPPQPYILVSANWYPPDIPGEIVPDSISPFIGDVVNRGVPPYDIYYMSKYFKTQESYDLLPLTKNTMIFSERVVMKILEFDQKLQFDPVYYPPVEE